MSHSDLTMGNFFVLLGNVCRCIEDSSGLTLWWENWIYELGLEEGRDRNCRNECFVLLNAWFFLFFFFLSSLMGWIIRVGQHGAIFWSNKIKSRKIWWICLRPQEEEEKEARLEVIPWTYILQDYCHDEDIWYVATPSNNSSRWSWSTRAMQIEAQDISRLRGSVRC